MSTLLSLLENQYTTSGNMASCVGILQGRLESLVYYLEARAEKGDKFAAEELHFTKRNLTAAKYIWEHRSERNLDYTKAVEELESQGVL